MKGKIVKWNDSKGYGFISALNSELRVFVHISSFRSVSQRPKLNDQVTFEVTKDKQGRINATDVRFDGIDKLPVTVLFGTTFLVFVCASVVVLNGQWIFVPLYFSLSLFTYLMYAWDKQAAQTGGWRTSENVLHMLSLIGGWPGALLAQNQLRHKSQKQPFKSILWVTIFLNIGLFSLTFSISGHELILYLLGNMR
ncbi:DUF1294 domain-containing protein [Vibrio mangrovi]|uniref:Cold shock and DUF1294 domain-containing protein n=1 Tax=Vibrio mangrovi TaxID=474394 RepID=A0A1Y6ISE5_9VIBR|nr:cold shock and DUF1294 domain-containing protein [Vibrio mangrovi]MDW6004209.1 cold shock and DUF1294 domain-containing protein [Vibrio mangrovi]SMR98993.1 cold shock protein CspE [Vibrio mangrovi]